MFNKKFMNLVIGITGIGGDIGLGILKSVKESKYKSAEIIGFDSNPYSIGLYKADKGYMMPKAEMPNYIPKLIDICRKEKVNLLFISTEQELSILSEYREKFQKKTKTKLVIASKEIIEMGSDKWKTIQFLKKNNLPYPKSILFEGDKDQSEKFIKEVGFPLIIKPIGGRGSKNLHLVKNLEEFEFYRKRVDHPILQEYLQPSNEEYTCGVFSSKGKVYTIIFKRELNFGLTVKAIVSKDKEIEKICQKIAEKIRLEGPINIQMRKTDKGPVPFEINPRFSSTVSIRNRLGFRDVEWSISLYLLGKANVKYKPPREGTVTLRYFEDFFPKKIVRNTSKFFNI